MCEKREECYAFSYAISHTNSHIFKAKQVSVFTWNFTQYFTEKNVKLLHHNKNTIFHMRFTYHFTHYLISLHTIFEITTLLYKPCGSLYNKHIHILQLALYN